jgi:hypothetical protein
MDLGGGARTLTLETGQQQRRFLPALPLDPGRVSLRAWLVMARNLLSTPPFEYRGGA